MDKLGQKIVFIIAGIPILIILVSIFLPFFILWGNGGIIAVILIPFLAYWVIKIIKKWKKNKFDTFVDFVLSTVLPIGIWSQYDPDFKYIEEKYLIYLFAIPFIISIFIYLKWKTTIFSELIKILIKIRSRSTN